MNNEVTLITSHETSLAGFEEIKKSRDNVIWHKLHSYTVCDALNDWLETLTRNTKRSYRAGTNILASHGLLQFDMNLQTFALINHDAIVDKIKTLSMSEASKQARCALYISFTRYLARRFPGIFHKANPCRDGPSKTFFEVREKCLTEAMNQVQWLDFFDCLEKINPRDCLIGKIALQGGKRITEVLNLTVDCVNFDTREIRFVQMKTRGIIKETVITYSSEIMEKLKKYVGERDGFVFITRKNTQVHTVQLQNTFARAGKEAGICFKVTPHVLRTSAVTHLKKQGFADSDIMKITGHTNSQQISAYDKSDRADNPSKRVNLI